MFFRTPHLQVASTLSCSTILLRLKIVIIIEFTFWLDFFNSFLLFWFLLFWFLWIFNILLLLIHWNWYYSFLDDNICDYEVSVLVANALLDRAVVFFRLLHHFFLLSFWWNNLSNWWCSLSDFFAFFFRVIMRVIGPVLVGCLLFDFNFLVLSLSHFDLIFKQIST